jgi:hypothetical protein
MTPADVFMKQVRLGNEIVTVGAVGCREGERFVMGTDKRGGAFLYPWDAFVANAELLSEGKR